MYFRFEKLHVWQEARKFVSLVYRITSDFPATEQFGLTSQIRRAAISIVLNIVEGSDRKSDKEFVRFLRMAITSAEEVVAALYIVADQEYLNQDKFSQLYKEANILVAKLNKLIESVKIS